MKKNKQKKTLVIAVTILLVVVICIMLFLIILLIQNTSQLSNGNVNMITVQRDDADNENEDESEEGITDENEEIVSVSAYTDSIIIRTLVNNNWNRIKCNFSADYEKDENGNYVYEGYIIYSNDGVYVEKIIFNLEYEDAVIKGLCVGATYDEIVETFETTPTFEDEQLNLYGYKTTTVYAFFYEDEIVIYPNRSFSNSSLENDLFEYIDGDFDGNQTNFVVNIKNNYTDFVAEQDGEDIILYSETRQIEIRLNGNFDETEITIYNGYTEGSLMKENKENYNIIEEKSTDLILLKEVERILSE